MTLATSALWKLYARYYDHFPLQRGKYLLGTTLRRALGSARVEIDGCKFDLDPVGMIDRRLIAGEQHDPVVHAAIQEGLANGGTFLDVGANAGYFTTLAAKMANTRVLAFEPSPRDRSRLNRHIELNGLNNVIVYPYGLSETPQEAVLWIARDSNPGMNATRPMTGRSCVDQVTCQFFPLTALVAPEQIRDVRAVKIDVEGAELQVLRGMEPYFHLLTKAVFAVEISNNGWLARSGGSANDIYEIFAKHGFEPQHGALDSGQYDEVFRYRGPGLAATATRG